MDVQKIGNQLRSRRAAAGRTVASVAMDAGLSAPYVANLENGRGNPTLSALTRLASALGTELRVSLDPLDGDDLLMPSASVATPLLLVRLGRTERFRRMMELIAASLGADPDDLASRTLGSLALAATAFRRELSEVDYWRLIDALAVIAVTTESAGHAGEQ